MKRETGRRGRNVKEQIEEEVRGELEELENGKATDKERRGGKRKVKQEKIKVTDDKEKTDIAVCSVHLYLSVFTVCAFY